MEAGLRPFSPGESPGGAPLGGSVHHALDYDSFVCFYACEEALRGGTCLARDIRYTFAILDEECRERIRLAGFDTHLQDTVRRTEAFFFTIEDNPRCYVWGDEILSC